MIYDWTRKQAETNPKNIAITSPERHVSYATLESESNRLASLLLINGLKQGGSVGLLMNKSAENIIAMHGINKAGGVIVPLNLEENADQITRTIETSELSFLMVDHYAFNKYKIMLKMHKKLDNIPWIWWSSKICNSQDQYSPAFSYQDIEHQPDYPFQKNTDENSPAYIYFESGAGNVKTGITISHKNISSFINWSAKKFKTQQADRITGHAPFHQNLSVFDIYGTFAAGAHLYLIPNDFENRLTKLYDFVLENDITQWFVHSSVLFYMARFDMIPSQGLPGLKRLIWHGKEFPIAALQYWMKQLPDVSFTNLYGSAESTVASSYYTVPGVPKKGDEIPIGTACGGGEMHVLNEELKPVPMGGIGDLYISGDSLSSGYWKDKEKTEVAFIWYQNSEDEWKRLYKTGHLASLNADGLIYYHGQSGYKIKKKFPHLELEEIETALGNIKNLTEYAVVKVKKEGVEKTEFGCAYASKQERDNGASPALKKLLSETIPNNAIPHHWKSFKKLPRKSNGKIDRKTLSEEFKL